MCKSLLTKEIAKYKNKNGFYNYLLTTKVNTEMKTSFILLEAVTDANTEEERNRVEKPPVPKQL